MESKKPAKFVKSLWTNWVQLNPEQRAEVASKLGPVGSLLNIAANVQQIANSTNTHSETSQENINQQTTTNQRAAGSNVEDDDYIDAEYIEVP